MYSVYFYLMLTGLTASSWSLKPINLDPIEIHAAGSIYIRCSDYINNTKQSDTFVWEGSYEFDPSSGDLLDIPIKSKWRSVGVLHLKCTASSHNAMAQAQFKVLITPHTIITNDAPSQQWVKILLVVAALLSALTVLGCVLLILWKARSQVRRDVIGARKLSRTIESADDHVTTDEEDDAIAVINSRDNPSGVEADPPLV